MAMTEMCVWPMTSMCPMTAVVFQYLFNDSESNVMAACEANGSANNNNNKALMKMKCVCNVIINK